MPQPPPTASNVDLALTRLGHYRVVAAQEVALEGPPDGISGALLLSLGFRETWGKNINNPAGTDRGNFQISDLYHADFLRSQPGCPVGSWRTVPGRTAIDRGHCPRYTPALIYALDMLQDKAAQARRLYKLSMDDSVRFALAAYNAGFGGARAGLELGDVDRFTTGGDYSHWVADLCKPLVNSWLGKHPNWRVDP